MGGFKTDMRWPKCFTVLRIDLGNEYAFAVARKGYQVSFLDCFSKTKDVPPNIEDAPIIFSVALLANVFKNSNWEVLDKSIKQARFAEVVDFAHRALGDSKASRYESSTGRFIEAEPEELEDLEFLAIWPAKPIERRLRDFRANAANRDKEELGGLLKTGKFEQGE